jgi:hypothetical protein
MRGEIGRKTVLASRVNYPYVTKIQNLNISSRMIALQFCAPVASLVPAVSSENE